MTIIIDSFLLHAWLAGIGISLASAPLGCFIAWQRLVYFGDTIAHAALLGVVLALLAGASPLYGMVLIAVLVALAVAGLHDDHFLPSDTLLGIAAHGSLALGLVLLALSPNITFDVSGLLFGDILAVSQQDIMLIVGLAAGIGLILVRLWRPLLRCVLHADIAQVEGIDTRRMRLLLMVLIALTVAVSIKLVGLLLITSLLILPAAAGRLLARSPGQMVTFATSASMLAVTLGLFASLQLDTPTGPSIILAALALLMLVYPLRRK